MQVRIQGGLDERRSFIGRTAGYCRPVAMKRTSREVLFNHYGYEWVTGTVQDVNGSRHLGACLVSGSQAWKVRVPSPRDGGTLHNTLVDRGYIGEQQSFLRRKQPLRPVPMSTQEARTWLPFCESSVFSSFLISRRTRPWHLCSEVLRSRSYPHTDKPYYRRDGPGPLRQCSLTHTAPTPGETPRPMSRTSESLDASGVPWSTLLSSTTR